MAIRIAAVPQDATPIIDATMACHAEWPETLPVIVDGEAVIRVYARNTGSTGWGIYAHLQPGVIGSDGVFYAMLTGDDSVFWPSWSGGCRDGRLRANVNARREMRRRFNVRVPVEWITVFECGGTDDAGMIRDEVATAPAGR